MKFRMGAASIVVCMAMMCSRASADVTIFGSTGLIYNPTARVAPQGQALTHLSYLREDPNQRNQHGINLGGAFGIAPRTELSLGLVDANIRSSGTSIDTKGVNFGLKYLWREETDSSPAVAVGFQHVNILKMDSVYVVVSKTLTQNRTGVQYANDGRGVRGHLGLRFDRMDAVRSVTGTDESEVTFYGGVEAALSPRVRFVGEANSRHDGLAKAPITATLHFALSDNASVFGGYARLSPGSGWIVGLSYGFGKTR